MQAGKTIPSTANSRCKGCKKGYTTSMDGKTTNVATVEVHAGMQP